MFGLAVNEATVTNSEKSSYKERIQVMTGRGRHLLGQLEKGEKILCLASPRYLLCLPHAGVHPGLSGDVSNPQMRVLHSPPIH
jgi:hypothetical protein